MHPLQCNTTPQQQYNYFTHYTLLSTVSTFFPIMLRLRSSLLQIRPSTIRHRTFSTVTQDKVMNLSTLMLIPVDFTNAYFTALSSPFGWVPAIVIGTIGIRLITLPIHLNLKRRRERMQKIQPILEAWQKTLSFKHTKITNPNKSVEFKEKRAQLYKDNDCRPATSFLIACSQVPIFMIATMALRKLASTNAAIKIGGILWFDNLAICDPTLVSPICLSILYYINSEIVTDRINGTMF